MSVVVPGRVFLQSMSERSEYLRFVADVTAGRTTLIAHVGALSSRDAWALSDFAAGCGYDIVASTPPFYFDYTQEEVSAYYRELALRSRLPVMVYNVPETTARELSVETQIEILGLPNVIGSKHTDKNFYHAERLMRAVEGTQLVNGPDEMLTGGLAMGMVGGIGSTYNMMPRLYLDIYRHMKEGDLAKARACQAVANDIIEELLRISPGVISGIKHGLKTLGYDLGVARKPFQAISADTSHFEQMLGNCNGL